jgi:hypothetical protein
MPLGRRIREVLADIAERGGAQQGIADGVEEGVAVRMTRGPFVKWNSHAAQDKFAVGSEAVKVVAHADATRRMKYEV